MIPDVSRGNGIRPLLAYLYGPGRREEHEDPHLIAAWDLHGAPDPGRHPRGSVGWLADRLDQHAQLRAAELGAMPPNRVWHCSVRAAPEDPFLSDEQWAQVAHRVVRATGLEPQEGPGCRWVAVRHAVHHIHLAAVTVLPSGARPGMHRDAMRAQAECRAIEAEWGLRRVGIGERTSTSYPTSAEIIKAERHGWSEPSRVWLQRQMQLALSEAADLDGYFAALAERGVIVRIRRGEDAAASGYSMARPGDVGAGGQTVHFAAGRLDSAMTLPRVLQHLSTKKSTEGIRS
ncbi:hypothetical protein ACFQ6N_20375 [Kitasatospora sp. NPDC056446]|uniref:hypothetical protein n=1 Tax=Kitasatospora sp. NPDC056446 TaxID=3345819 RepID=UPI0036A871BE